MEQTPDFADREKRTVNGREETVVSVACMRRSDAATIAGGVPGETLMYRAAMGVYRAVRWHGRIVILAGGGNNGGDGYALAGILAAAGNTPAVYWVSDRLTDTGRIYYDKAVQAGVPIAPFSPDAPPEGADILVDCMLGTGFSGEVRGMAREAILWANRSGAYVVSVDINSGMNGDTGLGDPVVESDLTVSIGYYKRGLFLGKGPGCIRALTNVPIGIHLA